ncbi:MAG: hypothetical protein NHF97_00740 [Flavobacteriia bacterium]|nr:hypothetical protein [Candidatus Bostrichicola ureolyticus]
MIKNFFKILLLISMFSQIFLLSSCNNNTKEVFDELNKKIDINNDKHDTNTKNPSTETNKPDNKINNPSTETNKPDNKINNKVI